MKILDKTQMLALLGEGKLGNSTERFGRADDPAVWDRALLSRKHLALRSIRPSSAKALITDVQHYDWRVRKALQSQLQNYVLVEFIPPSFCKFSCECGWNQDGFTAYWSRAQEVFKPAIAPAYLPARLRPECGTYGSTNSLLEFLHLLRHEDADRTAESTLEWLWDEYEQPTIEFTIMRRSVGIYDHAMCVWDVRHY